MSSEQKDPILYNFQQAADYHKGLEAPRARLADSEQPKAATRKKGGSVPSPNDAIMTPEFVDKVVASKLQSLDEAEASKEASRAADRAEAAEMMAEIAVRDALADVHPDHPQQ